MIVSGLTAGATMLKISGRMKARCILGDCCGCCCSWCGCGRMICCCCWWCRVAGTEAATGADGKRGVIVSGEMRPPPALRCRVRCWADTTQHDGGPSVAVDVAVAATAADERQHWKRCWHLGHSVLQSNIAGCSCHARFSTFVLCCIRNYRKFVLLGPETLVENDIIHP